MPYPGNTFYRSELEHSVLKELDEHNAVLNGFLSMEHGPDGGHTDITAESIRAGLVEANVVAQYLRLNPAKQYSVKATDLAAFVTDATDPDVSYWYANSTTAATINGMYVNDLIRGVPGHIQLVVNNSSFIHTYQSAVVTNACRLFGLATAVPVGPGGAILFVYDGLNLGWRYVGSSTSSGTGIPPNIAFTNVANVFTAAQTIAMPSYPTLSLITTSQPGTSRRWNITGSGEGLYLQATDDPPTVDQGHLLLNRTGGGIFQGNVRIGTGVTTPAQIVGLHVGTGSETPGVPYEGITAQGAAAPSVVSARCNQGASSVEVGMFSYFTAAYFGTFTNHPLNFRVGNNDAMQLDTDRNLTLTAGGIYCPTYVIANDYVWAGARLYVQGFRVTVTADCTIPGTGGGASLPPNLVYSNIQNHFGFVQWFDGGANISAPLTINGQPVTVNGPVTLNDWFDQNVKTSGSPTFANITSPGMVSAGNLNVTNGITATTVNAQSMSVANAITASGFNTPSGPGVTASTRVQVGSGPDWFLRFVGGVCTYFGV